MPPEGIEILPEKPLLSPVTQKKGRQKLFHTHNAVGSVHGSKPPNKLQVTICLLLVELCEKFTFYGIVCNMILFCTIKLGYCNYQAVIINLGFVGACMVTPVLIGWLAEFLVGRIKLVYMCALLHFIGRCLIFLLACGEWFLGQSLECRVLLDSSYLSSVLFLPECAQTLATLP